jgi:hypothetical protein
MQICQRLGTETYRETVELSERHFESKGCVMGREKKGEKRRTDGEGQMKFCADPARRLPEELFLHQSHVAGKTAPRS